MPSLRLHRTIKTNPSLISSNNSKSSEHPFIPSSIFKSKKVEIECNYTAVYDWELLYINYEKGSLPDTKHSIITITPQHLRNLDI